jgi:nicotinate-nucleotide pyrophosphorylase (carboxylating)
MHDEQTNMDLDGDIYAAVESIVAIAISSHSIIAAATPFTGIIVARQPCCAALLEPLAVVITAMECDIAMTAAAKEGAWCHGGTILAHVSGSARDVLSMERTVLNVLTVACSTATMTRRFVDAVAGTKAKICETRKTLPGLRTIQKYAVKCGGGHLHRRSLADAVMFKDNHLADIGLEELPEAVEAAIARARGDRDLKFACVEVDSLRQLKRLLTIPAGVINVILLDNMSLEDLVQAVAMRDRDGVGIDLEASGGITLETVQAVAETGVDRISVGAVTHSVPVVDMALDAAQ